MITSINRGKTGKCVTDLQYYLSQPAIDAYLIPVFSCYLRENKGKDLPFIGNLSLFSSRLRTNGNDGGICAACCCAILFPNSTRTRYRPFVNNAALGPVQPGVCPNTQAMLHSNDHFSCLIWRDVHRYHLLQ